ncbi:MAG TPA: hypothetical protein VK167_05630, partial [Flavipsychrobacter sp.]|nr:hypothetical protein [Flavipsychrobacter sp.]
MKLPLISLILLSLQANAQYTFNKLNLAATAKDTSKGFHAAWFRSFGNKMIFAGSDHLPFSSIPDNTSPYLSDGSTSGTTVITPSAINIKIKKIIGTINNSGKNLAIFLPGENSNVDRSNPWVTDGTPSGTFMLKNIIPERLDEISILDNKVFFPAAPSFPNNKSDLWVTDGTIAGTQIVKDIYPGGKTTSINIIAVDTASKRLYFGGDIAGGKQSLWVTDGTNAGTVMIKDFPPGEGPGSGIIYNGKLLFVAKDASHGGELWTSDGTSSGTYMVKDINPGTANGVGSLTSSNTIVFKNKLLFVGSDANNNAELWTTDGTQSGTVMLNDINPGSVGSYPYNFTLYNEHVYFIATDAVHGKEIWKTDGNTVQLFKDMNTSGSSKPFIVKVFNKHLFFIATNLYNQCELFYTNGTDTGTYMIRPYNNAYSAISHASSYIEYNNKLFFCAPYDGFGGQFDIWYIQDSVLALHEGLLQQRTNNITLYPNPAHHNFTLKASTAFKAGSVTLTDVTGRVVKTEKLFSNEQAIPL